MCVLRSFVKKIIITAAESTMKRLRISKAAFDTVHTLGTNNNGIVKVLRRHSTRTVHTFTMTQLGPDLQAVPPSTEQVCLDFCLLLDALQLRSILRAMRANADAVNRL